MWNENLEDIIVVKRSGQRVDFNASKIAIAIKKGFEAVYDNPSSEDVFKVFESVLTYINDVYKDRRTINVEDIQDIIENALKKQNYIAVYNAYHNYREKRQASRKVFSEKQQHKFIRAMEKLNDEEGKLLDNSTPQDTLIKFGGIISSEYVKAYTLDSKTLRALEEGLIYIDNLDNFSLGYINKLNLKIVPDLKDKCLTEFIKKIESSLIEVKDEVLISSLDLILEDYFLESYKNFLENYIEKYLSFSGLIDFVSLKRYSDVIRKTDSTHVIKQSLLDISSNDVLMKIANKALDDAYKELELCISFFIKRILAIKSKNAKLTINLSTSLSTIPSIIKRNILENIKSGDYNEKIHIMFDIKKGINYISDLSSLIVQGKNISINRENICTFEDGITIKAGINGENSGIGRMVDARISLNMARIALKCTNKDINDFYDKLDNALELVKNAIILEFETLGNKNRENYEVLFRGNILGDERLEPNQKIRKIIKTGTLNIGLIGLYECASLIDKNKDNRFKTILRILKHIDKKVKSYREEYKLNFVLYEPSDKTSLSKLIEYDKSIYNIVKGVTDKDAYSNIYEYFDEKELQAIQEYLQGGFIINIKMPPKVDSNFIQEKIKMFSENNLHHISFKRSSS